METIFYLMTNSMHTYAIYILFTLILGKSRLKHYGEVLTFFGHYVINSAAYLLFDTPTITVMTNIIPLIIISLQYQKSVGYKFFCIFSSCALGMFCDFLTLCVLPEGTVLSVSSLSAVFIRLMVTFLIKHFIKNKETALKSNHIWFIVLVSLGTIVIGVITIETVTVKNMIIAVVLMMINFLNFYMYDRDLKNLQVQHTFKLIETSNHAYQNQLKIMNESQKKIRLLKHDMKNHMYKMQKLIMNGEYQEAENYIEEMTGAMSVNNEYVNTGNNDVDCLLNYKLSIAKEMNVEFSCDISLPEKLSVSSFDMTTILGNLLDNSLNALKKTDDKQLNISIKYSKGTIQINIENTYRSEKKQDNDKNQGHGLGLLSIRQTLEKYHGILNITHTENIYCVNIFMYNGLE